MSNQALSDVEWSGYLSRKWRNVRSSVLDRDEHTCRDCGEEGKFVHHLESPTISPEKAYDPSMLVTLCFSCHIIRHGGNQVVTDWQKSSGNERRMLRDGSFKIPNGILTAYNITDKTGIRLGIIDHSNLLLIIGDGSRTIKKGGFFTIPSDLRAACDINRGARLKIKAFPPESPSAKKILLVINRNEVLK